VCRFISSYSSGVNRAGSGGSGAHADLPDVVERGEAEEEIHGGVVQPVPEPARSPGGARKDPDVVPGALDVAPRLLVPGLRQAARLWMMASCVSRQFPGALADCRSARRNRMVVRP